MLGPVSEGKQRPDQSVVRYTRNDKVLRLHYFEQGLHQTSMAYNRNYERSGKQAWLVYMDSNKSEKGFI